MLLLPLLLTACDGFSDGPSVIAVDDVRDSGFDDTDGAPACLDEATATTLADWLHATWLVAYGAPGSASASAVPSFYQLPGVPAAAWFSIDLSSPCATPQDRDPLCTGKVCYQVECLDGGAWVNHVQNEPDVADTTVTDYAGWVVDRGRVPVTWGGSAASLAVEYDVKTLTAPDGADWTFSGTGTFNGDLALDVTFPGLHPDGPLHVVATGQSATFTVYGPAIATWNGSTIVAGSCR